MAQPLSAAENKVVVGIDFGTTFSGVAWAKIGDDHPNLVQLWPGDNAPSSEKVPTQILYDKSPAGIKWGYQIPSMAKRYQSFKLALETTQPVQSSVISQCYSDPKARTSDKSHTAEQLTEDYLKALKSHLVSTLGHELGNLQAQNTPLEFLITVPAVWSDLAKEKTLTAAEKAGLADHAPIHMISEPEAAAIYVLQRKKLHNLLVGDTFVVCDAGGGTVDLISYTVVKLHPIVEVKEAAPGSGGRYGSTFINGRFKDYLQFKLRHETGWDDEVLQEAMNDFEIRVKRNYSFLAPDEIYTVSVPGLCQNSTLGINKRGKLILKSKEVREILEPVIAEVVKLVLEQIKATKTKVKSILLVGGFGGNKYLHEQIQAAVNKDIEVIKPPYAWSAVVQGALIKNLSHYDPQYATVHLSSRAARKHLGTLVGIPFDKDIHLDSQKYFDPCDGIFRIRCMEWFIKKGDAVTEDTPFNFHYCRKWLTSEGQRQEFTTAIYCDRTSLAPGLYRDYKVKELVQLKTDISTVPQNLLPKILGKDGKRYYQFNYSIKVVYESAHTKYTLIHDGKGDTPKLPGAFPTVNFS